MTMTEINACEIFNQIDKKYFTLYVEWLDLHFKVVLLEPSVLPLSGEMNTKDISYFCGELSKSPIEYLQETKEILCGKNDVIQFFIQNEALEWKKNVWTLGRITLYPVLDVKVISEYFQQSLKFYQSIQDKLTMLEKENKNLIGINKKLYSDIEKMIEVKNTMEQDIYKKFMLILNSKKKKLRELKNIVKEKQETKDSVFNVCTDESEESEEENTKINNTSTVPTTSGKRKSIDNNNSLSMLKTKRIIPTKKTDFSASAKNLTHNKVHDLENCATEEVGSINKLENYVSGTRKSSSSLNFIEEVSEEELFP